MRNPRSMFLLCSALLVTGGCMFDHGSGTGHHDGDSNDHSGHMPPELLGHWYAGAGGVSSPYDAATGSWATPSGQGLLYVFSADGSFTKGFQSFVSSGGCTTGYTAASFGRVLFQADRLTTRPERGTFLYRDTCAPSLNSDEPLDELGDETFDWAIVPDEIDPSAPVLWLRRIDGAEGLLRRL
jgi:hypothetical protein